MEPLHTILAQAEEFLSAMLHRINEDGPDGASAYDSAVFPAPDEQIEALREAVGELDAEVEAFLRRGFQSVEITFDEEAGYREYTGAGTDFMEVEHILRDLEGFRAMVEHYEPGTLLHTIHADGVQLSYSEPSLVWTPDGVTRVLYDGDSEETTIAPTLAVFFRHWLATGCFMRGDFKTYYAAVRDLLPEHIAPQENLWLQFYQRQYGPLEL
jgi:hypothetical protein